MPDHSERNARRDLLNPDSEARDTSKWKTFANTFTVNGLECLVNQPRAGFAQELGRDRRSLLPIVGHGQVLATFAADRQEITTHDELFTKIQ